MKWIKVLLPTAALSLLAVLALAGWPDANAGPSKAKLSGPIETVDTPPVDVAAIGDQCVSGTLDECGDFPTPVNGTCSCTWEVTSIQCQCDNGRRGHLEGNKCNVCSPCYPNQGCDINACITYHSYICIEGRAD